MKKRLFSLLLAGAMACSLLPVANAVSVPSTEDMAQVLSALDIMTGDENGNLKLDRSVTRAEFTKLIIAASPLGENVGAATSVSPYPDVPSTSWEAPYVEAAVSAGYVNGYLDGTFHPDEEITLAMGVTMVVRLLGYSDSDFSGAWPTGQMTLYHNLDLDEGISVGQDSPITRMDALHLFYNLLTAENKQGKTYLTVLKPTLSLLNASGEIDRVALVNSATEGPIVISDGWQSKVNFDVNTATVYRNGNLATLSAIQPNDVLYSSKSMHTLWVYSNKVTGLCQAISPSTSNPSSVTVAGKTYAIETTSAAYALSNLGSFKVGDTITLLLGRDGGVAAVVPANQIVGSPVGVVSAVSDSSYTDQNGNSYTAKTVTVTATDGVSYSYPTNGENSIKPGSLVQISLSSSGEATLTRLNSTSVSGKVPASADKIGTTRLAETVEILDSDKNSGNAVKIYPSRLADMTLAKEDVRYVRKNDNGEIDRLILNNVTGDLHSYGVLTSAKEANSAMVLAGYYTYDIGGISFAYQTTSGVLNLSTGPVQIEGNPATPDKISPLNSVRLTSVDTFTAVSRDNVSYPVADSVAVYVLEGSTYRLSSLERIRTGYSLTGYYDRSVKEGGRIRVIVAKPNQ